MRSQHLLNLGNPRKVIDNLCVILEKSAIDCIEHEINSNVNALLSLSNDYYAFAIKQSRRNWRQKVSRLYYAAYNGSRAVRLFVNGEYSTDGSDHKKFVNLPEDFPVCSTYKNKLYILREDRNTCDYDHLAKEGDLVIGVKDSEALVSEFLKHAKEYLTEKGLNITGGE